MFFTKKLAPYINLTLFYVAISVILRIVLVFHPITQSSFSGLEILKIFSFGLVSDVFVFILASGFLWLYLIFVSNRKYQKPFGYIHLGLLVALFYTFYPVNQYLRSMEEV